MIKITIGFCAVLFCAGIMMSESYQTHVSNPVITTSKTNYLQGENVVILGWVNYNEEPTSDVLLRGTVTNPQGVKILDEYVTSDLDGTFSFDLPIPENAEIGEYIIEITSQCREVHREICTHKSEVTSITVKEKVVANDHQSQSNKIPDWVKIIFVWYAEEKVSEDELLEAIEFLVNQNIIKITST
jgi:hypothetical protein